MQVSVPLRRALATTGILAGVGLAYRLIGGALDPDLGSWVLVVLAPLFGLAAYVQATGRDPYPPVLMIGFSIGALLLYAAGLAIGGLPVTPADWALWAAIFGVPVLLLILGVRKLRRNRLRGNSPPPSPWSDSPKP